MHTLSFYHPDFVSAERSGVAVAPFGSTALNVAMTPVGLGDVNADGHVNSGDGVLLIQFLQGRRTPDAGEFRRGDMAPAGAPNGVLDAGDLLLMMRAL